MVATVVSYVVDCDLGTRDAILAPRVLWSAGDQLGVVVEVIPPFTEEHVRILQDRGYEISRKVTMPAERRMFIRSGAVNAVAFDPKLASFCGVGDPRRQGFALAARY